MTLTPDQLALVAAIAHRERTPAELASTLGEKPAELERRLRSLSKLGLVASHMDKCPLCRRLFGGRIYSATEQGLVALAGSPLLTRAARA